MLFLTFLHTPKSNYDTLTDSLMINYSSKFVRKKMLNPKKKKKKRNMVGIACCFDAKLFIQVSLSMTLFHGLRSAKFRLLLFFFSLMFFLFPLI